MNQVEADLSYIRKSLEDFVYQANPIGVMLSAAMLLRHIGETEAGDRLESAVVAVLADGGHVTRDLRSKDDDRPAVGTFQVAEAVIALL